MHFGVGEKQPKGLLHLSMPRGFGIKRPGHFVYSEHKPALTAGLAALYTGMLSPSPLLPLPRLTLPRLTAFSLLGQGAAAERRLRPAGLVGISPCPRDRPLLIAQTGGVRVPHPFMRSGLPPGWPCQASSHF